MCQMPKLILMKQASKSTDLKCGVIRADGYTEFKQQDKLWVTTCRKREAHVCETVIEWENEAVNHWRRDWTTEEPERAGQK